MSAPRLAAPGLHALITTRTGEIHRYVLPVRLDRVDGLVTREPVLLIVTATADEGSLALRGVETGR